MLGLSISLSLGNTAIAGEVVPDLKPKNVTPPTLTGPIYAGTTATEILANNYGAGTWTGADSVTPVVLVAGVPIAGGDAVADGDVVTIHETATNVDGSRTKDSAPVTVEVNPVVIPENTVLPTLTDVQVDGAIQTLDYGTWTDAATLSIQYGNDSSPIGSPVVVAYGDPFPTRAYDYAAEVGKLRWIEVTATSASGGVSQPMRSPVRMGEPNNTHTLGAGKTALPIINAGNEFPFKCVDRTGAVFTDATALRPTWTDGAMNWSGAAGSRWWTCEFPSTVEEIEFVLPIMEIVAAGDIPAGQTYGEVRACAVPYDAGSGIGGNSTGIAASLANQTTVYRLQVNVFLDNVVVASGLKQIDIPKANITANPTIRLERKVLLGNPQWRAIINNNEAMATAWSVDITAAKLLNAANIIRHIYGSLGSGTFPWKSLNSIKIKTQPTAFVSISAGTVAINPDTPNTCLIPITGETSEAELEYAVVNKGTGKVVTDWTGPIAITGGDISTDVVTSATDGETLTIYFRSTSDNSIFGSTTATALVLPTVGFARLGMNEGYVNGPSSADPFENWGARIEWRDTSWNYITARGQYRGYSYQVPSSADGGTGTVKLDRDGRIYKANGLGLTTYRLIIPAWFREPGTYVLKLAPGLAISRATGSTTWAYATGGLASDEMSVTTDANGHTDSAFDIVLNGAFPDGGILPVGKKQGDAYSNRPKLPAMVASSISATARGVRVMTSAGINGAINTEAGRTDTALPVETPTNACTAGPGINRTGADYIAAYGADTDAGFLWYPTRHIAGIDLLKADMGKIAALMTSTSRTALSIFSELGNELWNRGNTAFYVAFVDMYLDGLRQGFAPIGVTTPGAATAETIIDGTPHIGSDGVLRATSRTFTSGEKVFVNWSAQGGFIAITVTATITAGQSLSLGGGGNCTMLYDNTSSGRARMRAIAYRAKLKWAAEDEVLAAAGLPPTIHVFSWQAAKSLSEVQDALDFDDFRAVLDRVAIAPYWGDTLGEWSDTTWAKASKEKIYSGDTAGFIADFVTAATADITAKVNHVRDGWVLPLALDAKTNRGDKDAYSMAFYESGWHVIFNGWPDMCALYAGGTYKVGEFVLGSDGKTYVRKTADGSSDPVSDATRWDVYWNEAVTTANRGDGAALRTCQAAFETLKRSPEFAALQKSYYQQMAALGVREMMYFDRVGLAQQPVGVASATGQIQSWAGQRTEADTAVTGGDTNYMFKALTELKTEFAPA